MAKKRRNIFIFILVVIVIIGAFIFSYYLRRVKFYDDESTTGNTSGNLLNGGLFCESDGKIYFSNPYDEGMLYCMDTDLGNVKRISEDNVSYLNVAGNYIFYTKRNDKKSVDSDFFMGLSTTGLFRVNLNGDNVARLYRDPTQVACLYGNNVYYQHYDKEKGLLLYSAKIDGSEDKKLLDEPCAPFAISNGTIYYAGYNSDHSIHAYNISSSSDTVIYSGNCTNVMIQGDYLYFMDMNENYALKRIAVNDGSPETLISDRLATYNVSEDGNTVYCQVDNGKNNGLYQLDINSRNMTLIASGNYNYLHFTNDYLFYEEYDQSKLYVLNLATGASEEWNWTAK